MFLIQESCVLGVFVRAHFDSSLKKGGWNIRFNMVI